MIFRILYDIVSIVLTQVSQINVIILFCDQHYKNNKNKQKNC